MPAHSTSKTRVNALVWRASRSFLRRINYMDGRDKPDQDGGEGWYCSSGDADAIGA
jgi:hypothetical protein